jgi:hypothetical protein
MSWLGSLGYGRRAVSARYIHLLHAQETVSVFCQNLPIKNKLEPLMLLAAEKGQTAVMLVWVLVIYDVMVLVM